MAYLALYRAWRPQTFEDVIGQKNIVKTLQNSLREKRFAHAYLFSGPRGTGKTSTAKIFAKAVNCEQGPSEEPCNECKVCKGITEGTIFDVVEIDAASNRGVEEIRDLREKVKFAPTQAKYKVYIIDEVHMLTTEAFNALLKTLEEPPEHVIFILATTEPHKLPLTIISRVQRFDFRRITIQDIVEHLEHIIKSEGFTFDVEALTLIAKHSDGGMRDSLSLLDQVLSFSGEHITVEDVLRVTGRVSQQVFSELAKELHEGNTVKALEEVTRLFEEGKDPEKIIEDLLLYYRDLLLYKSAPRLEEVRDKPSLDPQFPIIAEQYKEEEIYEIIEIYNKYLNEMKWTNQPRILLELAVVKTSKINRMNHQTGTINLTASSEEIESLKNKINELESKINHLLNNEIVKPNPVVVEERKQGSVKPAISKANSTAKQIMALKEDFSSQSLNQVKNNWTTITQEVKKRKITVYAWLMDGEPVAATKDAVVISFKNVMHRDTTEKPANRQIIETVISEIMNSPYNILTLLQKDWDQIENQKKPSDSDVNEEPFALKPEHDDDMVAKAIELFGEDLIEIKD